jgi:hypothetical protein
MPIGLIAAAVDGVAVLVNGGFFVQVIAVTLIVPVQVGDVSGYLDALGVVPGPGADAVAGIDGICTLGAEVGAPGVASPPRLAPSPIGALLIKKVMGACSWASVSDELASDSVMTAKKACILFIIDFPSTRS